MKKEETLNFSLAEEFGLKPFDWLDFLNNYESHDTSAWGQAVALAKNWLTNPVGNQSYAIKRDSPHVPKDNYLANLGACFTNIIILADLSNLINKLSTGAVSPEIKKYAETKERLVDNYVKEAKRLLVDIEYRGAELIVEIAAQRVKLIAEIGTATQTN